MKQSYLIMMRIIMRYDQKEQLGGSLLLRKQPLTVKGEGWYVDLWLLNTMVVNPRDDLCPGREQQKKNNTKEKELKEKTHVPAGNPEKKRLSKSKYDNK